MQQNPYGQNPYVAQGLQQQSYGSYQQGFNPAQGANAWGARPGPAPPVAQPPQTMGFNAAPGQSIGFNPQAQHGQGLPQVQPQQQTIGNPNVSYGAAVPPQVQQHPGQPFGQVAPHGAGGQQAQQYHQQQLQQQQQQAPYQQQQQQAPYQQQQAPPPLGHQQPPGPPMSHQQQMLPPHQGQPGAKRLHMEEAKPLLAPQQSLQAVPVVPQGSPVVPAAQKGMGPGPGGSQWRRQALLLELADLDRERQACEEARSSKLQQFKAALADEVTKDEMRRNMLNRLESVRGEMEEADKEEQRLKECLNKVQENQARLHGEARQLHSSMREEHNEVCGIQETRADLVQHLGTGLDQQRALEQRCYGLLCELWGLPAPQV